MIQDIRNWIGDIASGHIKDAKLALTETQVSTLLLKINEALSKIDVLKTENSDLRLQLTKKDHQIALLTEQLAQAKPVSDRLDENCEKILALFFDHGGELSDRSIAENTGLPASETQFFLDRLQDKDLIFGSIMMVSDYGVAPPRTHQITPEGRAYFMRHLRNKG